MNNSALKAERERAVFEKFLKARDIPCDGALVENREPPEPDILYIPSVGEKIAFELSEICSEEIAKTISTNFRSGECTYIRADDSSKKRLKEKLLKPYKTEHPIELLLYTNGRTASPDSLVISNCTPLIECHPSTFRKIWFWGDSVHLLFCAERS